jgi:hypothetical protein
MPLFAPTPIHLRALEVLVGLFTFEVIATAVGVSLTMLLFLYGLKAVLVAPYVFSYYIYCRIRRWWFLPRPEGYGWRTLQEREFANYVAELVVKKAHESTDKDGPTDLDGVDGNRVADGSGEPQQQQQLLPNSSAAASNPRIKSRQFAPAA